MRTVYAGACKKGCQGPVLRTLQRFGALGRRSNGPKGTLAEPEAVSKKSKDCRCLAALSCNSRRLHVNNFSCTGLRETVLCMGEALVVTSMNAGNLIGALLGNMCVDTSAFWRCIGPHRQQGLSFQTHILLPSLTIVLALHNCKLVNICFELSSTCCNAPFVRMRQDVNNSAIQPFLC